MASGATKNLLPLKNNLITKILKKEEAYEYKKKIHHI